MLQVTRDTFVRIVLYYPNYIYDQLDSGSSGLGSNIGVMTPEPGIGATMGQVLSLFASLDQNRTPEERAEIYKGVIARDLSRSMAKSRKYRRAEATYKEV